MNNLIYGVGLSDGPSVVCGVKCPYHQRWRDMLKRCYSKKYLISKPSYKDCSVCDEWLTFSTFKAWMETQDWQGNQLDKDIVGDGKIYNPENCVFVSNYLNQFVNSGGVDKPSGVSFVTKSGRYLAQIGRRRMSGYIGMFSSFDLASKAYQIEKRKIAEELAREQTDYRIADALLNKYTGVILNDC